MERQVWFITGSSSGIGLCLTETVLNAGHQVVATARNLANLFHLTEKYAMNVLLIKVDVNNPDHLQSAVNKSIEHFGRIDVLVNNAGYGLEGVAEECSMNAIREQFETNFFGLCYLTQLVLPHMRKEGYGTIFNISSIAGIRGYRGMGIYNASKFAVNGFSEALAQEVAPFGIQVSIVAPGPYRTDWAGRSLKKSEAISENKSDSPYFEVNQQLEKNFSEASGKQPGDPIQIAAVLLAAAQQDKLPMYMIMGDVAMKELNSKLNKMQDESYLKVYPHNKFDF